MSPATPTTRIHWGASFGPASDRRASSAAAVDEVFLRGGGVDDRNRLRLAAIAVREGASGEDREADGSEEVGADDERLAQGRSASFAGGRPLTTKVWRAPTASAGSALVAAAASTPSTRWSRASSASCRRATALSSRCFHSGVTICAVSRGCGSKPMSTRLIAIIDRTTSVATTRASSPMRPARHRARDGCARADRARGAPTLLERLAGLIV